MSKHVITVLQEDIYNGNRKSPCYCPIAMAVSRALNNDRVTVTSYYVWVDGRLTALLPDAATDFIRDFDRGRHVEPFEFEIEIPEENGAVHGG